MNQNDKDFLVQQIRTQYTEKEHTQLDALKELDREVKRPANVFAYIFGSIGALIMGSGMSLVMTDIGGIIDVKNGMLPGILIGIVGSYYLWFGTICFPMHLNLQKPVAKFQ